MFSCYRIEYAASCEQSKVLALGKLLIRCRWQIKDKQFGTAVDKIKDQRMPEDFIGYRKTGGRAEDAAGSNPVARTK